MERRRFEEETTAHSSPSSIAGNAELQEIYDSCVAELPPEYRDLVLMKEYEAAPWEDIQRKTGALSVHAAQQKNYPAQIRLSALLKGRIRET